MSMYRLTQFFDFSAGQLKLLAFLAATALLMAVYLLLRSYAVPQVDSAPLPVFFGDEEKFVGLFVLDPNTSPADSLELLPGVGRILADRIVEYRQTHRFRREVDITEVKGIGAKLFERIRPYLRVHP